MVSVFDGESFGMPCFVVVAVGNVPATFMFISLINSFLPILVVVS